MPKDNGKGKGVDNESDSSICHSIYTDSKCPIGGNRAVHQEPETGSKPRVRRLRPLGYLYKKKEKPSKTRLS